MSKARRGEHARQAHQGQAATDDQATARPIAPVAEPAAGKGRWARRPPDPG
ncbi:MAG: hypothetical protein ACRDTX_31125 [Pseudonocardiaceae bacterium]